MKYLQLKVCEGCGGLWLRASGQHGVYCAHCTARLSSFPRQRALHPGGRPRLARNQGCCAARKAGGSR